MDIDLAAVRLDKTSGDRQSKPSTALLPRDAVVNLLELVEDPPLIGGWNARTGVLDRDLEKVLLDIDADLDKAGLSELDRVADDIEQNLG